MTLDEGHLRNLIAAATADNLQDDGRYFGETADDLTRCRHDEIGEYQHRADGPLVEYLWNARHEIADLISGRRRDEGGEVFHKDIALAERTVEELQRAYLKRWGWRMTCQTPGAYWLWERDWSTEDAAGVERWHEREAIRNRERIEHGRPQTPNSPKPPAPYGKVAVPLDMAVSMTVRALDEQPELGTDDDDG